MKQHKKFFCSILTIIFFTASASAQREFGIATSDWGAMNSLYLNPASIAGCNERVDVTLFSLNLGVDNNLGTFTKISNLGNINNSNSSGSNSGSPTNGIFTNSGHPQFSMLLPTLDVHGPGALVAINDKITIAVSTRVRAINQLNNFDQSLYSEVTTADTPTGNYTIASQKFNWTADVWSELNLSYGMIVMDNENGQIKVGATLRHMSGIAYIGLKSNNLNIKYTSGNDSFYASKTDLEYASNILSAGSAITSGISQSGLFGNLLGLGSSQGGGFGGDLGVTYSRMIDYGGKGTDKDNSSHKISASASVTDIGAINYKNSYTVNVSGNGYLSGNALKNNISNVDSIKAYALRQGFNADTGTQATKVHMPTALLLSADYQVYNRFCVNLTYIANLVNRQLFGNSVYNQVTLTPRYDIHLFTVGLPITYSMLAHDLKMGFGFRVGGFFMGSDDMLALFASGQYGFNFYMGGYIPIRKKDHKKTWVDTHT